MKHNIRSIAVLAAAAGVLAVTIGAALLAFTAPAHASSTPAVKPGDPCTAAQAQHHAGGHHGSDAYECRRVAPGCFLWKYSGPVKGQWAGGPAKCPKCTTPTPTATATAVTTPTVQPTHPHPSHTTTAPATHTTTTAPTNSPAVAGATGTTATTGTMPVTGPSAARLLIILGVGLLMLVVGIAGVIASRRRTP